MASLRDIRKRIRSVKNTQQITKAMKMVAAAKLRRAQDAILAARPYAQQLDKVMTDLSERGESVDHPLMAKREVKRVEVLVLTSDRGLAGGFNANITRRVQRFLSESQGRFASIRLSTVGRKGNEYFKRRDADIRKDYPGLFNKLSYALARGIAEELTQPFLAGEVDQVYLAYNEFVSAISQRVSFVQLLPFAPDAHAAAPLQAPGTTPQVATDFLYEPSSRAVLERLIPQALGIKIFRALLESSASEHGARMSAMENASNNAADAIGRLTLTYNRTRQAVITNELMEIVSGAEALK